MVSRIILYSILILFLPVWLYAQQPTRIRGTVKDLNTGEPLPFASVTFPGFPAGTITNADGAFFLETRLEVDSIKASSLGYMAESYCIKPHTSQTLNFLLRAEEFQLEEVVIRPTENPAHQILRNILARRELNNLSWLSSYSYKAYNKIRIDINNVDGLSERRVLKPFDFVFNYTDTNKLTGKTYLPLLMSESFSDCYFQSKPKKEKEIITASRISGTQNESMMQLTGKLYEKYSVYDDVITLFEIGWVGPLAENGLRFYKYHLRDTVLVNGHMCYHITFVPLRKQERTFTGEFWVADTSWAIQHIRMQMSRGANINFVQDLIIENEYSPIEDSVWFLSSEKLYVDINLVKKTTGFQGSRITTFNDISLDKPVPEKILKEPNNLVVLPGAARYNEDFWTSQRPVELALQEQKVYAMIDSVQKVPLFNTLYNTSSLLFTSYYVVGLFEIGPYYRMYSFNPIEGNRFRFGGRTSNEFSTRLMLEGYLAYGLKDMHFKYGGGFLYLFNKNPRSGIGAHYENDMRQLGQSDNGFNSDNFLASFLRRNPNYKLTLVEESKLFFEKEWFQGFSNKISLRHLTISPTSYVPFNLENGGVITPLHGLTTTEISLNTRFAWQEKYLLGEFEKTSLGTRWPVVNLDLILGLKGVYGSQYSYQKINLKVSDDIEVAPYGFTRYTFDASAVFGSLPYPLLALHKGNETYQYDYMGFNMMNYYEFASDKYASIFAEHHFDGLFFNHIPVLRKMKLRELVTGRMLWGSLRNDHQQLMQYPEGMSNVHKGYYEAGLGIENIFRFFRVDAIWRLSYLNHPDIQPFGIRVSMQVVL